MTGMLFQTVSAASLIQVLCFTNFWHRANSEENSSFLSKVPTYLRPAILWTDLELMLEGNRLLRLGQFKKALPYYTLAISKENRDEILCQYYALRGKCQSMMGMCRALLGAIDDYRMALQKSLKNSEGGNPILEAEDWLDLGDKLSNCKMGHSLSYAEKAIECYDETIKLNSSVAEYFAARGHCYFKGLGNLVRAMSDLQQAIKLDPKNEESQTYLKDVIKEEYRFGDREKEAMTFLNDHILSTLCAELRSRSKYEESLYCLNLALERNPDKEVLTKLHLEWALLYQERDELGKAMDEYKIRVQLNPQDVEECWFPYVEILLDHNLTDDCYRETMSLVPDQLAILAPLFMAKDKYQHALWILDETIRRDETAAECYKLRSLCYLKLGREDEAMKNLKSWVQLKPENEKDRIEYKMLLIKEPTTKLLVEKGRDKIGQNKFSMAMAFFNEALKEDPKCEICYEERAFCRRKLKDYDNAIKDLRELVKIANWDLIPQIDLSEVLVDAKYYDTAEQILVQIEARFIDDTAPTIKRRVKDTWKKIEDGRRSVKGVQ